MGKKIVLISLPVPFASEPAMNPPLGLAYLASFLKKNNFNDISVLDFTLHKNYDYFNSRDYLKEIPLGAEFYGIYCMSVQFFWLIQVSQYIKANNPAATVITGGPHASTCPEECL
ncbi:MAG: cobalamin-dependent protein, partial [Candidatus Omnitrophota bacterium]